MNRRTWGALLAVSLLALGCGEGDGRWPQFVDIGAGLPRATFPRLAWGDYDNDGDLDLALAGLFGGGGDWGNVYRNDGGAFIDIGERWSECMQGCSLAWGDYDGDGDLDIALAGWDGDILECIGVIYRNEGGAFVRTDAGFAGPRIEGTSLAWGDYDNDGDLDIALVGEPFARCMVYRNEGGAFMLAAELAELYGPSLAWGDYDNDGDLDLGVAGSTDGTYVYRNDGGGAFTDIAAGLTGVLDCSLAWGDYDNDGDLDLALSGWTGSALVSKVYRNDGGGAFVDIEADPTGVAGCSLAWGDCDSDGDLDLALAGGAGAGWFVSKVYRNEGGGVFTDSGAELPGVDMASLAWGDYDSDGDLDLALAGLGTVPVSVITRIYRNGVPAPNTPPAAPCALGSTVLGTDVLLSWNAATDAETPVAGLSYNLRVRPESGANDVVPGMADPATGQRRIPALGNAQKRCFWILKGLAPGTYFWSVQAIDAAFAGSPWAPEGTFVVP